MNAMMMIFVHLTPSVQFWLALLNASVLMDSLEADLIVYLNVTHTALCHKYSPVACNLIEFISNSFKSICSAISIFQYFIVNIVFNKSTVYFTRHR